MAHPHTPAPYGARLARHPFFPRLYKHILTIPQGADFFLDSGKTQL